MKHKIILLFLALIFISAGCPEEDMDLVNPPSFKESVRVRFINFSGDKANYQLKMADTILTEQTAWSRSSTGIIPPSDSAYYSVLKNGNTVFEQSRQTFFLRELNFSVVGLPSDPGDQEQNNIDTLISLTNVSLIPPNSINSFIKLFNAYPSENDSYIIRLGCPGGEDLNRIPVNYRNYSSVFQIRAIDPITFSLIKINDEGNEVVGTYEMIVDPQKQYTIFVAKSDNNNEKLYLLDEDDITNNALTEIIETDVKETNIRVINLSGNDVDLSLNGNKFSEQIRNEFITEKYALPACITNGSETFTLENSNTFTEHFYSPGVNREYSALVLNTIHSELDTLLFYPPAEVNQLREGKAVVRILNASEPNNGLTVSLGANSSEVDPEDEQEAARSYSTGTSLTSGLSYMKLSNPVVLNPGIKPINIFTATQPGFYLYSMIINLEADKDYLILTYRDSNNEIKYTLIEDDETQKPIDLISEGVLTQIVHAWAGQQALNYSVDLADGNLLQNAQIFYESSLGTILPQGNQNIQFLGNPISIDAQAGKRVMVVSGGDEESDVLVFNDDPMVTEISNFKWRFINAATDVEFLDIFSDDGRDTLVVAEGLVYGNVSLPQAKFSERQVSLIFQKDGNVIHVANDISLPVAKNYTLIFTGTEQKEYALIIQQEF